MTILPETKRAIKEMVCEQIEEANREGLIRYGTERQITFKQEMAYRLCHQDFFGLSTEEAAEIMGIDRQQVWALLNRLRDQATQLFPILPKRTAKVYTLFMQGYTPREIAEELEIVTVDYVQRVLHALWEDRERTGVYFRSGAGRQINYQPSMDAFVKETF